LLLVNGGAYGVGVDCFGSVLWAINQEWNSVPVKPQLVVLKMIGTI
jgi:hypothetical protein